MIDLGEWILDSAAVQYVMNRPDGSFLLKLVQPGSFLQPLKILEFPGHPELPEAAVGTKGRLVFHDDGPLFEGSRVLLSDDGEYLVWLVDDAEDPDQHWVVVYVVQNANWNHCHGNGVYHAEWTGQGLQEVLDEYLGGARNDPG